MCTSKHKIPELHIKNRQENTYFEELEACWCYETETQNICLFAILLFHLWARQFLSLLDITDIPADMVAVEGVCVF